MKKIFLAIIVTMFILSPVSLANDYVLDKIDDNDKTCIGCGGAAPNKVSINANGEFSHETESLDDKKDKCKYCGKESHDSVEVLKMKYAYKSSNDTYEVDGEEIECTDSEGKKEYLTNAIRAAKEAGEYVEVIINDEEWIVRKELIAGNRLLCTLDGLNLVYYDMAAGDLYKRDDTGIGIDGNRATKVRCGVVYDDGPNKDHNIKVPVVPIFNGSADDMAGSFFVCSGCIKCAKGCDRNVAVATDDLYTSLYCEDDTCAFVWRVENGYTYPSMEGLKCKDKHIDGNDYCTDHKCIKCSNPIIGVNMNNALADVRVYQGGDRWLYSLGCEEHFCLHEMCVNTRITDAAATATETHDAEKNIYYMDDAPMYCDEHDSICVLCGGYHAVTSAAYASANGRMICMDCLTKYCEADADGNFFGADGNLILNDTGKDMLKKCGNPDCGAIVTQLYSGLCLQCYDSQVIKSHSQEGTTQIAGIIVDMWKPIIGDKDIKDEHRLEALNLILDGLKNRLVDAGLSADDFAGFEEKIKEVFEEKGFCTKCGALLTKGEDGKNYCPSCGEGIEEEESSKGGNGGNGGYGGSSYSGADFSWNSTMGNTGTTGTTVDPSTCQHNNYPIPNTVTFSNITDTTHVQTWNCINCQTLLTETYEHTFINDECICGHKKSDSTDGNGGEGPKIAGITPDTEDVDGGETVVIKLTDDEGLAEIEYLCFWGDKKTVTKKISGTSVELELGTLPTEPGEYYIYIQSIKDQAGNEIKQDTPYIFVVGNGSSYLKGQHIDQSFENDEENAIIYEDDSDSPRPVSV